ncbi:hypothetical protein AAL_06297 [Moelleriella libera RCEF 2490]|uniref:Uncharacterized protein n=1 Tax=Moelleriella libera RCEF 2490 TaxID=1081109 RepID=A0A167Z2U8_9HYPO|nr:hypothetical protein AAL_06297 [Moelleriella libera RCEF 2490]
MAWDDDILNFQEYRRLEAMVADEFARQEGPTLGEILLRRDQVRHRLASLVQNRTQQANSASASLGKSSQSYSNDVAWRACELLRSLALAFVFVPYCHYVRWIFAVQLSYHHVFLAWLVVLMQLSPLSIATGERPKDTPWGLAFGHVHFALAAPVLYRTALQMPTFAISLYDELVKRFSDAFDVEIALSEQVINCYEPTKPGSLCDSHYLALKFEEFVEKHDINTDNPSYDWKRRSSNREVQDHGLDMYFSSLKHKARRSRTGRPVSRFTILPRFKPTFDKHGQMRPPVCLRVRTYCDFGTQTADEALTNVPREAVAPDEVVTRRAQEHREQTSEITTKVEVLGNENPEKLENLQLPGVVSESLQTLSLAVDSKLSTQSRLALRRRRRREQGKKSAAMLHLIDRVGSSWEEPLEVISQPDSVSTSDANLTSTETDPPSTDAALVNRRDFVASLATDEVPYKTGEGQITPPCLPSEIPAFVTEPCRSPADVEKPFSEVAAVGNNISQSAVMGVALGKSEMRVPAELSSDDYLQLENNCCVEQIPQVEQADQERTVLGNETGQEAAVCEEPSSSPKETCIFQTFTEPNLAPVSETMQRWEPELNAEPQPDFGWERQSLQEEQPQPWTAPPQEPVPLELLEPYGYQVSQQVPILATVPVPEWASETQHQWGPVSVPQEPSIVDAQCVAEEYYATPMAGLLAQGSDAYAPMMVDEADGSTLMEVEETEEVQSTFMPMSFDFESTSNDIPREHRDVPLLPAHDVELDVSRDEMPNASNVPIQRNEFAEHVAGLHVLPDCRPADGYCEPIAVEKAVACSEPTAVQIAEDKSEPEGHQIAAEKSEPKDVQAAEVHSEPKVARKTEDHHEAMPVQGKEEHHEAAVVQKRQKALSSFRERMKEQALAAEIPLPPEEFGGELDDDDEFYADEPPIVEPKIEKKEPIAKRDGRKKKQKAKIEHNVEKEEPRVEHKVELREAKVVQVVDNNMDIEKGSPQLDSMMQDSDPAVDEADDHMLCDADGVMEPSQGAGVDSSIDVVMDLVLLHQQGAGLDVEMASVEPIDRMPMDSAMLPIEPADTMMNEDSQAKPDTSSQDLEMANLPQPQQPDISVLPTVPAVPAASDQDPWNTSVERAMDIPNFFEMPDMKELTPEQIAALPDYGAMSPEEFTRQFGEIDWSISDSGPPVPASDLSVSMPEGPIPSSVDQGSESFSFTELLNSDAQTFDFHADFGKDFRPGIGDVPVQGAMTYAMPAMQPGIQTNVANEEEDSDVETVILASREGSPSATDLVGCPARAQLGATSVHTWSVSHIEGFDFAALQEADDKETERQILEEFERSLEAPEGLPKGQEEQPATRPVPSLKNEDFRSRATVQSPTEKQDFHSPLELSFTRAQPIPGLSIYSTPHVTQPLEGETAGAYAGNSVDCTSLVWDWKEPPQFQQVGEPCGLVRGEPTQDEDEEKLDDEQTIASRPKLVPRSRVSQPERVRAPMAFMYHVLQNAPLENEEKLEKVDDQKTIAARRKLIPRLRHAAATRPEASQPPEREEDEDAEKEVLQSIETEVGTPSVPRHKETQDESASGEDRDNDPRPRLDKGKTPIYYDRPTVQLSEEVSESRSKETEAPAGQYAPINMGGIMLPGGNPVYQTVPRTPSSTPSCSETGSASPRTPRSSSMTVEEKQQRDKERFLRSRNRPLSLFHNSNKPLASKYGTRSPASAERDEKLRSSERFKELISVPSSPGSVSSSGESEVKAKRGMPVIPFSQARNIMAQNDRMRYAGSLGDESMSNQ